MHKFLSIFLSFFTLIAATSVAKQRGSGSVRLENLKTARQELEIATQNQILEKLEAARLEDERNRLLQFESLNFSVVNDGTNDQNTSNF